MKQGLRFTLYFVSLMWLLVAIGLIAMHCGQPDAINMVVGVFPPALVGTVAFIIEYRCERGDHD